MAVEVLCTMKLSKFIIGHRYVVIIVWIVAFMAMTPAILGYSHYISYSSASSSNPSSESSEAQAILQNNSRSNSTVFVLVTEDPFSGSSIVNNTLQFQDRIVSSHLKDFASSSSVFTAYAGFINKVLGSNATILARLYNETEQNATRMYSFPASFYVNWSLYSFKYDEIFNASKISGFNSSNSYEKNFINYLNETASANNVSGSISASNPYLAVRQAILYAYNETYPQYAIAPYNSGSLISYQYLGLGNFSSHIAEAVSLYLSPYVPVNSNLVNVTLGGGNIGIRYVREYGLSRIPSFILDQYVSPDWSAFLIEISFSVPSGYVGPNDFQPSVSATPYIENASRAIFSSAAMVTGNGPITEQTQQVTQKSAFVFGILFIILAIAVAITLVSWKSAIIALVFVSMATALGYLSIFISGILLHSVNYIVNYTLTAVAVGVSTDYLIFIASRYRQEIKEGALPDDALETATSRAGRAVIISGLTVGLSLSMFSFIPGFRSWGIVLLLAILFIVLLETTLFPAILSLFGPKFFTRKSIEPVQEGYHTRSRFHKAARFSYRRRAEVVAIVAMLGVPAAYFFFNVPTSYNFNTGLPESLPAVKALGVLEEKFGSNLLYPIEIVLPVNATNNHFTPSVNATIMDTTSYLIHFNGVIKVIGPYSNGTVIASNITPENYSLQDGKYVYYLVYSVYSPYSEQALNQVKELRSDRSIIVGGVTSSVIDEQSQNSIIYPELEILIIAVIFSILLISFRTPKYGIISLIGVFFSISWTTAILYLISRFLLHESLIYLIPIILFIILMSLGNDYTVFIVSTVREYESKMGFRDGMPRAMASSGRVVTSLGLILAVSLGSLGFIPDGFLEQLGIAFFVSLILDTFIIRTFFFPAMLSILRRDLDAVTMKEEA